MWFDSWSDIGRILAVGAAAYVTLVVVLRLTGKRTLAKLNAFDFVVTVALGSTLATILLSTSVSWADGATALALLAGLQLVVAWLLAHQPGARTIATSRPTLLLQDGAVVHEALLQQRMTVAEVRQAVRSTGSGSLADVAAVVLESDGSLSVIGTDRVGDGWALADVTGGGGGDNRQPGS